MVNANDPFTNVNAKPYPVVKIEWIDAEAESGWKTHKEASDLNTGDPCTTIGFLVRKPTRSKPDYIIASTLAKVDNEPNVNSIMKIPKAWIKSVIILEVDYNF